QWGETARDGLGVQPRYQRLYKGSQLAGSLNRERGIADAQFNGTEFGLGPDIPIQILDGLDQPGLLQLLEMLFKVFPTVDVRRQTATKRKGVQGIEAATHELGID